MITTDHLAPDHLAPETAKFLSRSDSDRIFEIRRDHWVGYPRAKLAIETLTDLLEYPRVTRMPNLLLCGPSGIGKTTIIDRLRSLHPVTTREEGQAVMPIVALNMATVPSETRFWSDLLRVMAVSYRENDNPQKKKNQVIEMLSYLRCRLLIIDEIHNILNGGHREQTTFLSLLKNLSNELGLPVIGVGTGDAITALRTEPELARRFNAFGLERWELNSAFLGFLATYERMLPLKKPSKLIDRDLAIAIYSRSSDGLIGEVTKLLKHAAVAAVRNGDEKISLKLIESIEHVPLNDY